MVTAAATATANRIPVLFLPGDTYACRQPDPVLQQIEQFNNLSITVNDSFKSVSKYWDRINRPEQLMTSVVNAMKILTDPENTGAVTLALPQDVQGESYDYPKSFFRKRVHYIDRVRASERAIKEAIELIKKKKKPLVICGGGVRYSGAEEELIEFCERFNIPFAETQAGKGIISSATKFNLGGIGTTGNLAANLVAKEADLIIGLGTRYTDFTTASKWLFQNPEVEFLNINIGKNDSIKMEGLGVVGDIKVTLKDIIEELNGYKSKYEKEFEKASELWKKS